jgi:hypothetical protein
MKYVSRLASLTASLVVAVAVVATVGNATAAPTPTPPKTIASGPQAKPPIEPGSRDAKKMAALGSTSLVKTDTDGKQLRAVTPLAGSVSGVDFQSPLNYCYRSLTYTPVRNTTTATKYIQVRVYSQGSSRDYYTSISANSYAYPAFYGNDGAFTAYLYVWNGSSYVYDEYVTGTNTCNVSVTRTYNTGGWVQLKIQNLGTAYASQRSTELAPYPGSGTYTGTQYDYPTAGGAAIYRWFSVGTSPYGIESTTLNSYNVPVLFTGDL